MTDISVGPLMQANRGRPFYILLKAKGIEVFVDGHTPITLYRKVIAFLADPLGYSSERPNCATNLSSDPWYQEEMSADEELQRQRQWHLDNPPTGNIGPGEILPGLITIYRKAKEATR